jgi:hypothetical protein
LYKIYKLLFFILLNSALFGQTTYYISSSLGNDSNSGKSQSSPWKSLNKLNNSWAQITPGDKILFKRGDGWFPTTSSHEALIAPKLEISGTQNNHIVLGAYGEGGLPIISTRYLSNLPAFKANANRYLTLQDIEFRGMIIFNAYNGYKKLGTHNIKLLRLKVDGYDSGHTLLAGISFYSDFVEVSPDNYNNLNPMHNIEIGYCIIKNTGATKFGTDAINIYSTGSNWIHHNKIYNCIEW